MGPWLEPPYQKQIHHNIEVPRYGVATHAEATCELCRIEHLALVMREHLPISAKGFGRNARTERGDIALKVCLYEGCPPCEAGVVVGGKKAVWKAATCP